MFVLCTTIGEVNIMFQLLVHIFHLLKNFPESFLVILDWVLCLMAYQLSWVTWCQSYFCRRTVVVNKGVHTFPKGINQKETGVWTRLLKCHSSVHYPQHYKDSSGYFNNKSLKFFHIFHSDCSYGNWVMKISVTSLSRFWNKLFQTQTQNWGESVSNSNNSCRDVNFEHNDLNTDKYTCCCGT